MGKSRIVIVDDSPFSIALIREILEEGGFEVVGTAGNLEEVKEVIAATKPDLVTMDMTLLERMALNAPEQYMKLTEILKLLL
jgi:chemotaxis response regulator CheB